LEHVGVGALAATWSPTLRAAGANQRIRWGLIGCGQRGRWFFEGADYVCDPDQARLAVAAQKSGVDSRHAVTDMRRILDDPDIDAVVIAAPDHWHAPAAILACQAGKHVYVEKPCSHNFREAQLLVQAARDHRRVVQHGTQQRSTPFTIEAIEMLHAGAIGEVLVAKAWNIQRRSNIGFGKPGPPPAGVDYDLWVGPAQWVPFQANRFHSDWHWWYNFGTGDIGNDGAHEMDYARWGLGVDTLPTRIMGLGGKYFFDDDQQFPDTATCAIEYEAAGAGKRPKQLLFEMRLWSKNYPFNCDSGVEFFGTQGKMFLSKRGKMQLLDENNRVMEEKRSESAKNQIHFDNFLTAIVEGSQPTADILEGFRSVAPIHLANIAIRTGRTLRFDPATERIVDDEPAGKLLSRAYREGNHWAQPHDLA
jgi:predicted dehydrogenase